MPENDRVKHIIVIASSTGGPKSLQAVVPLLTKKMDAAVVVVQHMPSGFTGSLAKRLDELSQVRVKEAENGEALENGVVYIAKGGKHLRIKKQGCGYSIVLSDEPTREGVRPCANYAFESLLDCDFQKIVCVVMTGMGADGTVGIRNLKKQKEIYTFAQDQDTSIIYGMPKSVVEAGLADKVIPLDAIANEITKKVGV